MVAAVDVPVTLKIRTGWDQSSKNGLEISRIAEDTGIQALAVHGRTRACKYKGAAEYETVAQIKDVVSIPVLANGDLGNPEKSLEVLRLSSVDGLMIGRAARGRPWVFRELNYFQKNRTPIAPLDKNKVRDIMLSHLDDLYQFYGDITGVRVARKHLTWYCAGLENTEEFRSKVVRVDSASEQICLTRNFLGQHAEGERAAA